MKTAFVLFVGLLVADTAALADQFRCPNGNIVASGDSIAVVAVKCEPPAYQTRRQEPEETEKGRVRYIEVQEWIYNQPPETLIHTLTFRNGVLTGVQTGGFAR